FFQAVDGIRDFHVTGVQTCALPNFETQDREVSLGADLFRVAADRGYGSRVEIRYAVSLQAGCNGLEVRVVLALHQRSQGEACCEIESGRASWRERGPTRDRPAA